MRIVIDSDDYATVGAYRWPHKIGYVNGDRCWTEAQIADASARGELLGLVDVLGTATRAASVIAWDSDAIHDGEQLHAWVAERNAFRGDATVVCTRDALTDVINALAGEQCYLWLIEASASGTPPTVPPVLGLPANLLLLGVKYATEPDSGGQYDISIFWDDTWHAAPAPREDEAGIGAGTLEPLVDAEPAAAAAAAAVIPGEQELPYPPPTGARMMNPDPGPSAPVAGAAASTPSSAAPPRPVPAGALSRPLAAAPAPSSPAAPSGAFSVPAGLLATPRPPGAAGPAALVPSAPVMSSTADTGHMDAPATAAEPAPASSAPATSSPASLPHSWIQAVISDMRTLAGHFHSAGQDHVTQLVEQAASAAAATGSLLQRAGL